MEFLKKSIKVDLYSIKSYRKWFIKIGLGTKPCLNRVKIIQSVKSRYLMGIALIRAFNSQHKSRHWSWSKDNNSNSIDVSKFLTNLKFTYRYYVISLWKAKTLYFQIFYRGFSSTLLSEKNISFWKRPSFSKIICMILP